MPERSGGAEVRAAALFIGLTIILTWPLATSPATSLPGDYGDPLFVTWAIGWVAGVLTGSLSNPGLLATIWDANIFFPEQQTLAFSEHFIGQTLMVLPVYWASGNLLLSYNAAFAASFVLTGLGTFMFARALTGSTAAGLTAGAIASFNQYRLVYEVAHLHVLSIQWFPFALLGLHRYFATDRRRYLVGATAAFAALGYSSVYYLAYCAPVVALFVLGEVGYWRRWRTGRVWLELWAAGALVLAAVTPVLLQYMQVQRRLGVQRPLDEVVRFSLTLDSYLTAAAGLAPALALAVIGWIAAGDARRSRGLRWTAIGAAALLALSFWLSLGPVVRATPDAAGTPGIYTLLYHWVPGFDGLRVPGRYASLVFVFLGLAAGAGVAMLEERSKMAGRWLALAATAIFLVVASPGSMPLDRALPSHDLQPPPAYLTPAPTIPDIYRRLETLPPGVVLAEFPFGDHWYDLRYMYFAAIHRRRLMNGYSGIFPPSYLARRSVLAAPSLDPARAAAALTGATHALLHRRAWGDDGGDAIGTWLAAQGARVLAESEGAVLFELPVREDFAAVPPREP